MLKDVKTRFDTSNYKLDRTLSTGKNENIIGLMMDKLGRKIIWDRKRPAI